MSGRGKGCELDKLVKQLERGLQTLRAGYVTDGWGSTCTPGVRHTRSHFVHIFGPPHFICRTQGAVCLVEGGALSWPPRRHPFTLCPTHLIPHTLYS